MNKKPSMRIRRVLIICEGYEEEAYLNRLNKCGVWNAGITVEVENAKSRNRIPSKLSESDSIISVYKDKFAMGSYAVVVILCDTEEPPYEDFLRIRKSITDMYGRRICDKILFFVNPCVMQLILLHGSDVRLKTKENREHRYEIEKFCGIKNYGKDRHDRDVLVSRVTAENYADMKKRIVRLSSDLWQIPSTNVLPLFDALDGTGSEWIDSVMEEVWHK